MVMPSTHALASKDGAPLTAQWRMSAPRVLAPMVPHVSTLTVTTSASASMVLLAKPVSIQIHTRVIRTPARMGRHAWREIGPTAAAAHMDSVPRKRTATK